MATGAMKSQVGRLGPYDVARSMTGTSPRPGIS